MLYRSRVMVLSFCLITLVTFKADAQQTPSNENLLRAQKHQLIQEMQGLHQQLGPLRLQMQQLIAQIKVIREQISSVQQKLRTDGGQLQALKGGNGQ